MYLHLVVITLHFTVCCCLCPDLNGNKVAWWILYQHKDTPFTHYYVDSTSIQDPLNHYPEMVNSVLSRAILSITETRSEYVVYSSDLINAQNIAKQLEIPTYSKWMHGIIGTNNQWSSGLWILHNNLFFPPIKSKSIERPGSLAWNMSTVGDSDADLFYICLSAGTYKSEKRFSFSGKCLLFSLSSMRPATRLSGVGGLRPFGKHAKMACKKDYCNIEDRTELESVFNNLMASNPFIIAKSLNKYSFVQTYLKNPMQGESSQFEPAYKFALNCMYADSNNVTRHCLFKHVIDNKITVLARPSGLVYHDKTFCYTGQQKSMTALVGLERNYAVKYELTSSMFYLNHTEGDEMDGTTCFGQDIGTNTHYVAVMICVHQQNLFKELTKSAQYSKWACPDGSTTPQASGTTDQRVCNDKECIGSDQNIHASKTRWTKNPLQKNFKISNKSTRKQSQIAMLNKTDYKISGFKQIVPNKIVRKLDSEKDISKYLINNENAVLGLFCQEGCRFCQIAKENLILLSRILQLDSVDLVIVNIRHPAVPSYLTVPWTPYLRFKSRGSSAKWKDAAHEQKYDVTSIFNFLHTSILGSRFARKKVDTKTKSSNENQRQNTTHTPSRLRVKRGVQQSFIKKHVWEHSQIDHIRFRDAESQFNLVKENPKLIPDNKIGNRKFHSFIVTTSRDRTRTELDSIATIMYMNLLNENENAEKLGNKLLPDPININRLNTSVSLVQLTLKPSRIREDLIVIECIYALQGSFHVGGSVKKQGFFLGHFDNIILDNNAKRQCIEETVESEPDGTCNVDG